MLATCQPFFQQKLIIILREKYLYNFFSSGFCFKYLHIRVSSGLTVPKQNYQIHFAKMTLNFEENKNAIQPNWYIAMFYYSKSNLIHSILFFKFKWLQIF